MAPHHRLKVLVAVVAHACLAFAAPAQVAQPADPLRGPSVPDGRSKSLVERGMDNEFRRVEGRPEAAALQLLVLDPDVRERATAVIDARAAAMVVFLADRIDAVKEITDAIESGDSERAQERVGRLHEAFDPGRPRDPLAAPLAEVLPPDQAAELRRLLDEYWAAWIGRESRGDRGLSPEALAASKLTTEARLSFQIFQEEIRRVYDETIGRYRQALEGIYTAVDPTPQQRQAIRELVTEHIRATRLAATPEQRRAVTRRVYDLLDDERRAMLFDYVVRQIIPDA